MEVKCYSVRLKSLESISEKMYKAKDFNGNVAFIPKSFVYGEDNEVFRSEAYWISAWILERRNLSFSGKKRALFDLDSRKMLPSQVIERYRPERKEPVENNDIESLRASK